MPLTVRIESVEIINFKNVRAGKIILRNTRKPYSSSIMGLYGQNGSGKTALIDALSLLKFSLTMKPVPAVFADYINVDASHAVLRFEFKVVNNEPNEEFNVIYEFKIRKDIDESLQNPDFIETDAKQYKVTVFDEILSYSYNNDKLSVKFLPVIDTRTENVFLPATKYQALVGKDKSTETNLLVAKKYAAETSRSFIFSREMLNYTRRNCKVDYHIRLFDKLISFGAYELFIINTETVGLITLNTLPLVFRYSEDGKSSVGSLIIKLNGSSSIPQDSFDIVNKVVSNMNIVLTQLVPGLTISIKDLGKELSENGDIRVKIQLMSNRNNKSIPLQYESEGIKKIVSILQLLIVVYNKASITVAVDELDSGVFEYLLGELLRIISEKGKGQLIFTSHNLRPLETLDRGFIAFTTTNPDNRYIRFSNVKTNNNLRDFYYRDIVLGEQSEAVYEPTNNYEIALAFREAGEISGS